MEFITKKDDDNRKKFRFESTNGIFKAGRKIFKNPNYFHFNFLIKS
jgi:hypothetical protein